MRTLQWLRRSGDGALPASAEHLFIHVDLTTRRACAPAPEVAARIDAMIAANTADWPQEAGQGVGAPRRA